MNNKYDDILKKVLSIPEIANEMKEQKISQEQIKKSLSMSDLLNILDTQENIDYTTTIFLDNKKNVNWKYIFSSKNIANKNSLSAGSNYVFKSFPDKLLELDTKDIFKEKERASLALEVSKIIKTIEFGKESKGLYITGKPGVGKSFFSIMMLNRLSRKGKKVAHIFMPDFMAYLTDSMSSSKSTYDIIDMLKKVEILLIDDLGSETISSWVLNDVLIPILSYRSDSSLTTFITSTFTPEQYIQHCKKMNFSFEQPAKRIVERIKMLTKVITLEGKNHRY